MKFILIMLAISLIVSLAVARFIAVGKGDWK